MTIEALVFPDISLDAAPAPAPGPIRLGSEEHKNLFCRTLLTTHDPYRPAIIDWPKLDADTQALMTSLPIWDIAVQTEGKAGANVGAYGEEVTDPLLKQAIALDAFEERRHKHVLHHMVRTYGIKLAPEPPYPVPRDAEWAFMVTGYSECIDSFFAFGLFKTASDTGLFPPELTETFELVMREEGRHILFFVNWVAWRRRNMAWWKRPWFELKVLRVWAFLVWERIGYAGDVGAEQAQDNNFTVNGVKDLGIEISVAQLMDACLSENARRLAPYDQRLLRPEFVPSLVRLARRFLREPRPKAVEPVAR